MITLIADIPSDVNKVSAVNSDIFPASNVYTVILNNKNMNITKYYDKF